MSKKNKLDNLFNYIKESDRFSHLRKKGINFVPSKGNLNPSIILVGEAPGRLENARREPFVGAAGDVLRGLLAKTEIPYEDVYFTNVLKFWPTAEHSKTFKTRAPSYDELSDARPFLMDELKIVAESDTVIGLCGRSAMRTVFPEYTSISNVHMMAKMREGLEFVFVYHPASLLYDPSKEKNVQRGFDLLGDIAYEDRVPLH